MKEYLYKKKLKKYSKTKTR